MTPTENDPPFVTRVATAIPAPVRPRPGFVEAVLWCVLFMIVLLLGLAVTAGVVLAAYAAGSDNPSQFLTDQLNGFANAVQPAADGSPPPAAPTEICQAIAYGMLAAQAVTFLLTLLVLRYRVGRDWKRQIGVRRPAALHVFLVVLMVPGLIILASVIQELFVRVTGATSTAPEGALRDLFNSVPWVVTLLAISIGPGVVEELWCRGFLGRGLCTRYGLVTGVFFTSLLFAAMHGDVSRILVYTLMGAFLHFVYLASRSIWVPVVLHLLNNGIAVMIELIPSWTNFVQQYEQDASGLRVASELAAVGLMVFSVVAMWTSRAGFTRVAEVWTPEYPGISAPPAHVPVGFEYGRVGRVALALTLVAFMALVGILSRVGPAVPG